MENKNFRWYYICSLAGVLVASFYPIYMGVLIVSDVIKYGTVISENYPKYVIPYTPISLAVIIGVAFMPLIIKIAKKFALLAGTAVSVAVFFVSEFIFENFTVTRIFSSFYPTDSKLEAWQMYACYVSPDLYEERTWTEVDVLMGEYSPAFKMHFYIISVVLIISLLNCFYGFAKMIKTGDKSRLKPLILQSIASAAFLGMCILACFTAFFRTGEIHISALSAFLMIVFFAIFGITMGIYVASFTVGKRTLVSVIIPAIVSSLTVIVMYIGEMILLSGNLYRFGYGFFFDPIQWIVLAPIDIAVIIFTGVITAVISKVVSKK